MGRLTQAGLALSATLLASGCITRCLESSGLKADLPARLGAVEASYHNYNLRLEISGKAYLDVRGGNEFLGLELIPTEGTRAAFESATVRFENAAGVALGTADLPALSYVIDCPGGGVEPKCLGDTRPIEGAELGRSFSGTSATFATYSISVSPTAPLPGARNESVNFLSVPSEKLRKYRGRVKLPDASLPEVVVRLPPLVIDGVRHVLPTLRFRSRTETNCYTSP